MVRCEKLIRLQFERVSLVRVWFVTIAGERIVQSIVGYLYVYFYTCIYTIHQAWIDMYPSSLYAHDAACMRLCPHWLFYLNLVAFASPWLDRIFQYTFVYTCNQNRDSITSRSLFYNTKIYPTIFTIIKCYM